MTEPQKAPAPQEALVTDLTLAVGQFLRRLRSHSNPSALNWSQLSALARLEELGWTTTADLARAEAMKPQSMGAILSGLELEGLVARRPHPTDGRQVLCGLTEAGVEARRQRGVAKRAWLTAALAQLSPDEIGTLAAAVPLIKRLGES
jgi:DNA-binding MarR family transcriptional regulator